MGLDFLRVSTKPVKKGKDLYITEVYPSFLIVETKDLMIRGGDLYAVWNEESGFWETNEKKIIKLIDNEIKAEAEKLEEKGEEVKPLYLSDDDNKMIDKWHRYCQKSMRDDYVQLDRNIIFDNTKRKKDNYATKCLSYHMEDIETPAYDKLMSTLYSPEEREKIEWCIGAIFSGDSKTIQKFLVITGEPGSGKSTVLKIMERLFEGYYIPLDTKSITSGGSFALEQFQSNPLVAIEHDGNLSRVYDNSRLNSMISHEEIRVNAKYKDSYSAKFDTFLIMASNLPVEITDAKSGLTRRIIDAEPSGNRVSKSEYNKLMKQIKFELGGIAKHCLDLYLSDTLKYDGYKPEKQISKTYRFYDFIDYVFAEFDGAEYVTLDYAWSLYKKYVELSQIKYPFDRLRFKNELMEFFEEFYPRKRFGNNPIRNVYVGFIKDKLTTKNEIQADNDIPDWLKFEAYSYSVLDKILKDCPAQYANSSGTPSKPWDDVETVLRDISPNEVHYVMPQSKVPNLIVIDFDIRGKDGEKSLIENIKAASTFPPTYSELSKGGQGLHLHYIWDGDIEALSSIYDVNVEIKVFKGKAALRRKLSECNDLPIATISTGLPLKEVIKNVVNKEAVKSERGIRKLIIRNLRKEIHDSTKPSIDFIFKILEDAYNSGISYDVSDMYPAIEAFAMHSTHQADYCTKKVGQMKFKSEEPSNNVEGNEDKPIIFFDVEVFPNLFILCHKMKGGGTVTKMINPTPDQIKPLLEYRLVGFNNRRYDNHILYAAAYAGYNNEQLFRLSQRIIAGSQNAFFGEAYNLSYADIYEYSSKKQSLKKWEIELNIYHLENSYPWDEPLAEEHWNEVTDYCANDVIATEKTAEACQQDFVAREILAKLSGLSVGHTTRQHTTKIIFGDDKNPELVYTDLSKEFPGYSFDIYRNPKSDYLGEDPSEGGYVYAEPGIYYDVALLDVASLHPHSILMLNLFGDYTKRYKDILDARIAIKHHDFETAKTMLNGALAEFLTDEEAADNLSQALKIVINSVYGYTTATFDNPFKDPRNVDNIVAKRGALFMMTLKREVQKMGYTVAHIKTDSIKIPNADEKIIKFCMDFGKKYGYSFEHEATYEKMCLVNDAVYIAKYKDGKHAGEWTATGTQFQVPYVFKTLFSKEPIIFEDMCETKSVTSALYLDFNEQLEDGEHDYRFVGRVGQFTPIRSGCGGAELLREKDGKYNYATGAKGYRWMESNMVKENGFEDKIDITYYSKMVDEARASIDNFGDVEDFIS